MSIKQQGGGATSDAICNTAREWMVKNYRDEAIVALRYYSDEVAKWVPSPDETLDQQYATHIRACEQCTLWIRGFAGDEWMERQRRLAQCCCPRMFAILENEGRKGESHMEFKKEPHPDAGWLWYQKFYYREVGVFSYQVNYCPWCGKHIKVPENA